MLGGLTNNIVGGEPIKSLTISLRTVESEIANSLTKVQNDNQDVEIGSYPFFHAGKLGVSIVIRSEDQSKIEESSLYKSTMDALTRGTQYGLNITLNVAALLIVIISSFCIC